MLPLSLRESTGSKSIFTIRGLLELVTRLRLVTHCPRGWTDENTWEAVLLRTYSLVGFVAPVCHWLCQCSRAFSGVYTAECDARVHWQSQWHTVTEVAGRASNLFISPPDPLPQNLEAKTLQLYDVGTMSTGGEGTNENRL